MIISHPSRQVPIKFDELKSDEEEEPGARINLEDAEHSLCILGA